MLTGPSPARAGTRLGTYLPHHPQRCILTHDDDAKHSVPCRLLAVLHCYGCLREEGGGYFRGQGDTTSRLRSLPSRRVATLRAAALRGCRRAAEPSSRQT